MTPQTQSPLDQEPTQSRVRKSIESGATNASIVERLVLEGVHTTTDSIRRFRRRHGLLPPPASPKASSTRVRGNQAEVRAKATIGPYRPEDEWRYLDDPDKMLEERGLDPTQWQIEGATVNEWDGPIGEGQMVTYHQAKLHLKRKVETQLLPARSDGWIAPPVSGVARVTGGVRLVAVIGDQQAPFHDENLHSLFCAWLEQNNPDELVSLGDGVDFPDISRHRLDPENTAVVNECIQAGYDLFRAYRQAAPHTRIRKLAGNHDERLRNILLDKPSVRPLYGVARADNGQENEPVLTIKHLMRFDELGVEYVDPEGPYELAQINLSKHLAVRHGWIARKGSGTSALDTLEHLGYSVIVGHTHRQSIVYKTTHDIDGGTKTLTAAEAGCMCRIDQQKQKGRKFPDFSVLPDWQQGFSTVTLHPDGLFRIENATYVNGTLLWRDQRYR